MTNYQPNLLAKWISGSRLYGTTTDDSDTDMMGIFKESLDRIILMQDLKHITESSNEDDERRNTKDDTDATLKELRVFIYEALAGKSHALEALFIPRDLILETSPEYEFIIENRNKLIGDLRPVISYCRDQVYKYAMKGDRLLTLRRIAEVLQKAIDGNLGHCSLDTLASSLPSNKYAFFEEVESKISGKEMFYNACGALHQTNLKIKYIHRLIESQIDKYGKRTKEIANKGYDGKAMSHALRLAFEFEYFVREGSIKFPLPEAELLTRVKLCLVDHNELVDYLDAKVEGVLNSKKEIGQPDPQFWHEWLLSQYK